MSEGISDYQVVPVPSHSQLSAQNESLRQKLAAAEATIAELTRERDHDQEELSVAIKDAMCYREDLDAANQRIAELEGALREVLDESSLTVVRRIAHAALSTHTEDQ